MPSLVAETLVRHHDPASGRWVEVVADGPGLLRWRQGTTGNRIDPERRVLRSAHLVRVTGRALEVEATWPVQEVVTHRIGDAVDLLGIACQVAGGDRDDALGRVAVAVGTAVEQRRGRPAAPTGVEDLTVRLWSEAYPLLAVAARRDACPSAIPLALHGLLRATDPRAAATRALGPRVTRPLIRALAAAVAPEDGPVMVEPLLFALMAAPTCGPEQLTAILTTRPDRPGAVSFDLPEVDVARAMFRGRRSRAVTERLLAALTDPDGTRTLAEELAAWVPPQPPAPPLAVAPARTPPPAPTPTPSRPPTRRADTAARLVYPPAWRALDGTAVEGYRVVLPGTADELMTWGTVLDNCLGGFRHAVAAGRTRIIGLARAGRLAFVVEVTAGGVIRQFEARGNAQAPASIAVPVIRWLRTQGIADADGRTGRPRLAPG